MSIQKVRMKIDDTTNKKENNIQNNVIQALGTSFLFTKGLNIILGNNGTGKTTVLKEFVANNEVIEINSKEMLFKLYDMDLKGKTVVVDNVQAKLEKLELERFAKFVSTKKDICNFVISMTMNDEMYDYDNLIELQNKYY